MEIAIHQPFEFSQQLLPKKIDGTRLRLTQFTVKNIQPNYIHWLNNPEVVRYSNQRFKFHTRATCIEYLKSFAGTSNQFFAIESIESGEMLGTLTVYANVHHQVADIGVLIGAPSSWGGGYGTEAVGVVINALTASGMVRKITAGTMAENFGMIKILERTGMHLEATRKEHEILEGKPVDILYYAKFVKCC